MFFRPLNPYSVDGLEMFKVEEDDQGKPLVNVWFYGISAKRYGLYDNDDRTTIRKYSAHGLGENLLGLDQEEFWQDILVLQYHPDLLQQILDKYAYRHAVYSFRVSSYGIWQRFKTLNCNKSMSRQVKPFNFITIGMGYRKNPQTNEPIIPMMPYVNPNDRRFKEIPYRPFVDYKTGAQYPRDDSMDTRYYWKPLSDMLLSYITHPESKSEGDTGVLRRRHMQIDEASIHYIGKESNQLEESETIGVEAANYTTYEDPSLLYNKILAMKEEDALKLGISARTLYYWKAKIREGKKVKLYGKVRAKMV